MINIKTIIAPDYESAGNLYTIEVTTDSYEAFIEAWKMLLYTWTMNIKENVNKNILKKKMVLLFLIKQFFGLRFLAFAYIHLFVKH